MAREPFDAGDPFDAMAESIRRAVADVVIEHKWLGIFNSLPPGRQLEAILAGSMTAILGIALIYVEPESRDEIENVVRDFVSAARENAEEMAERALAEAD